MSKKPIEAMRTTLKANKFMMVEQLVPEKCEIWSNEGGDDNIHVEWSGYFLHMENGRDGNGIRALKKMLEAM